MFEERMSQKIISFIEREGYFPLVQIPHFMGSIDFVGINASECIIIESKISKWKDCLRQAIRYGYGAEKAYVALPAPLAAYVAKNFEKKFVKYGIGIIEVDENTISILIECNYKSPSSVFKQMILTVAQTRLNKSRERVSEFTGRFVK